VILFEDAHGFVFSFGFDMIERKPDPDLICWCDPVTKEWESSATNQAGWIYSPGAGETQFVRQCGDVIVAYRPGACIELQYVGAPCVFSVRTLMPQSFRQLPAAA
jgi:hypothetical protein